MQVSFVIHYLDDLLIIEAQNSSECQSAMRIVLETFAKLGLPLAINKLEGTFWISNSTLG